MKTRNLKFIGMASAIPFFSIAATAAPADKVTINLENLSKLAPTDQKRVFCIAERLDEIAVLDRNNIGRDDRKALRSELRALKSEADAFNRAAGGTVVYISGAGLILIIILLIILF